jgi:hypothetical protein
LNLSYIDKWLEQFSFSLNSFFRGISVVSSYFENKKFNLLRNIKNTKNLENINEIFNTNNYVKNSISDENPFGSFKFNGKIYNLKICNKNDEFNSYQDLDNRFPSYELEQIEDEIRFIEKDPDINLSNWTTYYDVYKLTLEYGLSSFFNLMLNYILTGNSTLFKLLAMIRNDHSPNLKLPTTKYDSVDQRLKIGYMLEELFKNSGDSLKTMMNVLSYTYIIKGNDYKEEFNMRVDDKTVGVPCDYIEERSIEWK